MDIYILTAINIESENDGYYSSERSYPRSYHLSQEGAEQALTQAIEQELVEMEEWKARYEQLEQEHPGLYRDTNWTERRELITANKGYYTTGSSSELIEYPLFVVNVAELKA
jgi:hypothetical protein